jgi:hypothetical protein
MLYLKVGHLTTGLRVLTGLGATAAAFWTLALRRRDFLAGWLNHVFTKRCQSLWKCALGTIWLPFAGMMDDGWVSLENDGQNQSPNTERLRVRLEQTRLRI